MLDILLPSAYFCDLVFTGLPDLPKLGDEIFCNGFKVLPGAGFIPAVALTRLALDVAWACDFGNDFFSRYVLEEAERQNLSPRLFRMHAQPLQAVTISYSFAQDRAFLSYMDTLPPNDISDLLRKNPARCLLLMSLHRGPDFVETAALAHAQGSLIFMDGQAASDIRLPHPELMAALRAIDVFSVNEKEALQLTGENSIESALEQLADFSPTVVIKLGAIGAVATRKGEVLYAPGFPVHVVDTTGAGDNFDCGFVYGLLHNYSLNDCLRSGVLCGSCSTTAQGGWTASPTASYLEAYLRQADT